MQPPDVLHLVPAEPASKEKPLLRLTKRFPNSKLRVDYLKNMLGLDDKPARNVHANWQRLDSVRWLQHVKTGELVPVVGEIKEFFKSARAQQEDMRFDERSLYQYLSTCSRPMASSMAMEW